ncbi:MAG: TetR/AcrR family transcriptional regulator [Bacillota bacterium]
MESGRTDEKGQRIVDAAISVFSEAGFSNATMQDVASRAGVGKGTIYLYFSSKEDLLEKMLLSVLEEFLCELREVAARPGDSRTRLRRLFAHVLGEADSNREKVNLLLQGPIDIGGALKRKLLTLKGEIMDIISSLLEDGIATGEIQPVNVQVMTHLISGGMDSLAAARLWEYEELVAKARGQDWPKELAQRVVDCLWSGMKGAGEG